jgi:hypothetical protein
MPHAARATHVINGKVEDVFPLFASVERVEQVHPSVLKVDVVSSKKGQVSAGSLSPASVRSRVQSLSLGCCSGFDGSSAYRLLFRPPESELQGAVT